jgi:hypothetical protein
MVYVISLKSRGSISSGSQADFLVICIQIKINTKEKTILLVDKELPLLAKLFTEFDFAVTSIYDDYHNSSVLSRDLTKNSKISRPESVKIGNSLTKFSNKSITLA